MKTNTQTNTAPNLCPSCKAPVSGQVWCRVCGAQLKGAAQAPWPGDPSAPLVPLSAPVGVSGVALTESPATVQPVAVPAPFTLPLSLMVEDGDVEIRDSLHSLVLLVGEDVLSQNRAAHFVTACNSHSANLAKIKALEALLKDAINLAEEVQNKKLQPNRARYFVANARAALALPSA